jgi:hypothetical protein
MEGCTEGVAHTLQSHLLALVHEVSTYGSTVHEVDEAEVGVDVS